MVLNSILLAQLEKNNDSKSFDQNFWDLFKSFRARVAPELSMIYQRFPEFTPHDEAHHISSLLRLTDELLGDDLISNLNPCEQFILACSLYGHDWGMAVSKDEEADILSLAQDKIKGKSKFALLSNEELSIKSFIKNRNLNASEVSDAVFRDYVRLTHASRAKYRIQEWFREGKRRLGELVGIVSEGHWYDISEVRKLARKESCDGYMINLCALTAYIRLIDLLDIAENRTPYKLWKFVNPRDPFSAMEWKKHEALSPVLVDLSSAGNRVLRVHGSTSDYRVYANLQDLRNYCKLQFAENRELFVELGKQYDPRLSWMEWKVEANGFTPTNARFDFDRDRMFDLIAAEIYENDPFVFLRELVQNAIDAIVLRRELTSKIDADSAFRGGLVKVDVITDGTRPIEIRVKDNGIGMDVGTIERYLAVAGRSYYRSDEFKSLNLSMNPISRFGIGILSCFMVADELKLATRKERLVSTSEALEIEIPHIRRQFHIKTSSQDWTGTEVRVFLSQEKMHKLPACDFSIENVCSFLKTVAGLSPTTIQVCKNGTVVDEMMAASFDDSIGFVDSNDQPLFSMDIEAVFGLTNIDDTDAVFGDQQRFALRRSVGAFEIEAVVAYLERRSHIIPLPSQGAPKLRFFDSETNSERLTKWKNKDETITTVTNSWKTNLFERVFMNGILVPDAQLNIHWGGHMLPEPRVTVNIKPKHESAHTNISRSSITTSIESLGKAVTDAFDERIYRQYASEFSASTPKERVRLLSRIMRSRHMVPLRLANCWPVEEWPIPVFSPTETRFELVKDVQNKFDAVELLPFKYLIENLGHFANHPTEQRWMEQPAPKLNEFSVGLPDRVAITSDLILSNYHHQIVADVGYGGLSHLFNAAEGPFFRSSFARVSTVAGVNWLFRRLTTSPNTSKFPAQLTAVVNGFVDEDHCSLQFLELDGVNESCLGVIHIDDLMFYGAVTRARRLSLNLNNPLSKCFIDAINQHAKRSGDLSKIEAARIKDKLTMYPFYGVIPAYRSGVTEDQIITWLISYCEGAVSIGWLDASQLSDASRYRDLIPVYSGFF